MNEECLICKAPLEYLDADEWMEWVGHMNNIRARVTEIVNNELILA